MALFNKRSNVKPVSQLSRSQYESEVRAFRKIVPDTSEKQARAAIASRRRHGYVLDYKTSAVEKSRFRDDFGKRTASSNLGQLTKMLKRRTEQNAQRRGDSESQIRVEGQKFRQISDNTDKFLTQEQREEKGRKETEYWIKYREAMGYAA
jgi:hypothetical protein